MKVMVVDDDRLALELMGSLLSEAGYEAVLLDSPIGTTQAIQREQVDAIILDVNMPSIPGDRLARLIRGNQRWQELPVILVSAEVNLAMLAANLEGVSYLEKARVPTELVAHVTSRMKKTAAVSKHSKGYRPRSRVHEALKLRLTRSFLSTTPGVSELLRCNLERARVDNDPHLLSTETIAVLHRLKGEAQVLGLQGISELLAATERALGALHDGVTLTSELADAVDEGLAQLSHLPADPSEAERYLSLARVQQIDAALAKARRTTGRAPRG